MQNQKLLLCWTYGYSLTIKAWLTHAQYMYKHLIAAEDATYLCLKSNYENKMSISSTLDEDKIDIVMSEIDLNDDQDNKSSIFTKHLCNGKKETKDYDQDTVYSIPVVQGVP